LKGSGKPGRFSYVNAIGIEITEVDVHGHLVLPGGAYGWLTVVL